VRSIGESRAEAGRGRYRRIIETFQLFVDCARKAAIVGDVKLPTGARRADASTRRQASQENRNGIIGAHLSRLDLPSGCYEPGEIRDRDAARCRSRISDCTR
jgi:hypothetical protein